MSLSLKDILTLLARERLAATKHLADLEKEIYDELRSRDIYAMPAEQLGSLLIQINEALVRNVEFVQTLHDVAEGTQEGSKAVEGFTPEERLAVAQTLEMINRENQKNRP